ncbi:MAG: crossover junction endodeoxyribonuclease RuvC [Alphaproteobacteria bacterium]
MPTSRIIGVDPGLISTGWGVIEVKQGTLTFVACGTIAPKKDLPMAERLLALQRGLSGIIDAHYPTQAAIEETFVSENGQSTLKLGQARGALLVTLAAAGLPIAEYAARLVKKSITGSGRAEKEQLAQMVGVLLPASRGPLAECRHDAADALAIAITHANHVL